MRHFQDSLRQDGIRKVRGPGALRHNCPVNPVVGAGKDCFVYGLQGSQVMPTEGVVALNARFRLWVSYTSGHWQVVNYGYDLIPAR